jgi:diguanylate cyclase (GGDEF)-like protein/PAS domain S-box-containing protein
MGWLPRRRLPASETRPWLLFTAAGAVVLLGHSALMWQEQPGGARPTASWVDGVYLLGYCLLVAGEVSLARRRRAGADGDHVLDALLVGVNVAAVAALFVVLPVLRSDQPLATRLVAAAYTGVDVALIAGAARLALGDGARTRSWYLLVGGWASLIVVDLWPTGSSPPVFVAYLPFVLVAAAAADPSMLVLTEGAAPREALLTGRRLALLCLAMLLPSGLIVAALLTDRPDAVAVLAVASTVDAVLVLTRLAALVRSKERTARQEGTLGALAAGLLAASDSREIERLTTEAAGQLAGPGSTAQLLSSWDTTEDGFVGGVKRSPGGFSTVLAVSAPTGPLGALVITSRRPLAAGARRALDQLVDHVSLALVSAELREEVHRRRSERRFRAFIDHSSDLVAVIGADRLISFASPAAERLLGIPAAFLVGRKPFELVHPDDVHLAAGLVDVAWAGEEIRGPIEVRLQRLDGSWRWFEIAASAFEADGATGLVLNLRDVQDRKEAEGTLAQREARFSALVRHATDLVLVLDGGGRIRWASPSSRRLLGVSDDDLLDVPFVELVHEADHAAAAQLIASPGDRPAELRLRHASAGWRIIALTATDLREVSAVGGIVVNARDVTEAKGLEDKLRYRALHDGLTGLPNRALFAERVERALARSTPGDGHVVVLFIDLDDFKTVNDGLGHAAGDLVLSAAARRVAEAAGAFGTAARLGGDEFAVLLEGPDATRLGGQVGHRLVTFLARPIGTEGLPVQLGASVGIAANDTAGHSSGELLRGADVAMYLAKSRGKGRVERYETGMNAAVFERLEMKQDLVRAMADTSQMSVAFQPVVELASGRVVAVEALIRWQHPTRGAIPPAAFIPLAEDTGLIHPLGLFVLDLACQRLRGWIDAGHELDVHVNVSARQLEDERFVARFTETVNHYGLPTAAVVLELTESIPASPVQRAALEQLHRLGVRIAIDDFGTGYASWGYLADLPVDILKLDRSFVSCIRSEHTLEVVRAIIDVAKAHGILVVAEGIERPEEEAALIGLGCEQGQGWLFADPLAPALVAGYLGDRCPVSRS